MGIKFMVVILLLTFCEFALSYNCTDGKYGNECTSCGHCLMDAYCNDITGRCELGCEPGYQMPLCKLKCGKGYYGKNCEKRCGHCSDSKVCDMITGACPNGQCDTWYVGHNNLCNIFISQINTYTIPTVVYVKENWARLDLKVQLQEEAIQYYTFGAEYIYEHQRNSKFREYKDISSSYNPTSGKLTVILKKLNHNTQYWFRIKIFRNDRGLSEAGTPSKEVQVSTYSAIHLSALTDDQVIYQGVIAVVVMQTLTLLCVTGIGVWLVYQCYRQKHGRSKSMKLRNDISSNHVNSFNSSQSESNNSRVAFNL